MVIKVTMSNTMNIALVLTMHRMLDLLDRALSTKTGCRKLLKNVVKKTLV